MKEQILAEIKRLAEETGKAPGQELFGRATGIKHNRWRGVFWATWSDALTEAGFEPNAKTERFVTADVLRNVAQACRKYQHYPSIAELKLHRRSDPSFPNYSTIENHFQTRSDLLEALKKFVAERIEFDDVAALLPQTNSAIERDSGEVPEGCVYLLKSGGFYKIGRSDQLERRVKQITVALPETVSLVHMIRTDDPAGIEAYWHKRFAHLRANGEWFKLGPSELKAFRRRSYQ